MAGKKVGELIREARTKAELSQEALAKLIDGVSASDIGKAERGEKELTQAALKAIAKATGVTQKSLLEAPKGGVSSSASKTSGSSSSKKTSASAKTSGSSASSKKTSGSAKTSGESSKKTSASGKTASSSGSSKKTAAKKTSTTAVELTSAEKTLINAYRKADAETQKAALSLLKGEKDPDLLSTLLSGAMDVLSGFGKK